MASDTHPSTRFDVFNDSCNTSCDDSDRSSLDLESSLLPLSDISVSHAQNRQSLGSASAVESLATALKEFHIGESPERVQYKGKAIGLKAIKQSIARSSIQPLAAAAAYNPIKVLETVPEDSSSQEGSSTIAADSVSDRSQHYIQIPVDQYTHHPLSEAARNLSSFEEQLAKHRREEYEWVMTIKVAEPLPIDTESTQAEPATSRATTRLYFGCNLLPDQPDTDLLEQTSYSLLVTPLEGNAQLDAATELEDDEMMALTGYNAVEQVMPLQPVDQKPEVCVAEISLEDAKSDDAKSFGGDSSVGAASVVMEEPLARIEDSVEALDQLEEQLEAFDLAACMRDLVTHAPSKSLPNQTCPSTAPTPSKSKEAAPQIQHRSPRTDVSALRVNTFHSTRSPTGRRSGSMAGMDAPKLLDSPKLKVEDKPLVQAPVKKAAPKLTSLLPPKQPAKSTKPPTVPTFELPGEAVARRLKEQREARLSMAANAKKPEATPKSSLRRTKSAKPPTRPDFELPGEAISRRKREEREAKLKAEEEEERKRREFKAKPIRMGGVASYVPRDTATSRARQNKPTDGAAQTSPSRHKLSAAPTSVSAGALKTSTDQMQTRGRHPATGSSQESRATSSSNGSVNGKRSSVSIEDVQAQRARGKEILQRDGMFAQDKQREKREREALARLAREQAAERSRQLSRAWAEKQKQKRMTIGSVRDVVASSS
ncbi:hypothetical protein PFICI_09416 [Pestalotiopsis fici W106-1]|uniref:Carboxylesterase family protein n=1 Tax=Pestalotiopsis fici (strain W106-1 / CGMCC3.15140) TaxID=1229662 RepID=W3X097_PESFW|nr:uncharacterized protein PFICI_09416 [Pestalotiopsis fici W106-1]ETS79563.1 hypothetical protein PFICI_09416 [Pestalotiopsis fici W106-1]